MADPIVDASDLALFLCAARSQPVSKHPKCLFVTMMGWASL
jgi:hypothetical protein